MKNEPTQRRQAFLNHRFAKVFEAHLADSASFWSKNQPEADSVVQAKSLAASSVASDTFMLLALRYTNGVPIESLRDELSLVVAAHVQYQKALAAYEEEPQIAPLVLERISDYERCVQLIGLCYLLHRRDLLPVLARLEDPTYAETDTLYEDLLAWELEGRCDVDQWYHEKPYRDLINSMYRDTDAERLADLKAYCKAWYPAMSPAPWHDSHLRTTDTDGDYFGYWAFEAGAVAYLLDLDDSSIDHMVYPKDLVRFAREFDASGQQGTQASTERLRVPAGEPCPRAGWWFTPASVNSRRHFVIGEVMPELGGDYGATIWQWDGQQ